MLDLHDKGVRKFCISLMEKVAFVVFSPELYAYSSSIFLILIVS